MAWYQKCRATWELNTYDTPTGLVLSIVKSARGQHTRLSGDGVWPRSIVCVMAIGTRSYWPHPLLLWSKCVHSHWSKCCNNGLLLDFFLCDGWTMVPKQCFDWGPVKREMSTHTAPREVGLGLGRASAWGLSVLGAVGGSTARDQKLKNRRVTPGNGRNVDGQTDRQSDISASINTNKIETQLYKLR